MPGFKDLTGQQFGRLMVIARADDAISPKGYHTTQYLCQCSCGKQIIVRGNRLTSGNTKSCGCYRKEMAGSIRALDLTGQRFGKLLVIRRLQHSDWLCKCDCGNECVRKTGALTSGNTTGCGRCRAENFTDRICGDFRVLHRVPSEDSTDVHWLCRCEKCGHEKVYTATQLRKNPNCADCAVHYVDLTGQRFGRLVVLKRTDDVVSKDGSRKIQWLCQCDCGNYTKATSNLLQRGEKQSCGCLRKESLSRIAKSSPKIRREEYLNAKVGSRYGRLVIVDFVSDGGTISNTMVKCKCDCGNTKIVLLGHLVDGSTQSCGCLQREQAGSYAFRDLTGERIGDWTVLYQNGHNASGRIVWRCRCERCGNEYDVDAGNLRSGISTMCAACSYKQNGEKRRSDLVGMKFGMLTVESFAYVRKNATYWNCVCDCGNKKIVSVGSLTSGNTRSCGCWHQSKYEAWTAQYLSEHGVEFLQQVKFDDLVGFGGLPLRYDFGIYENGNLMCFIECQGQQHYQAVDLFGGESEFEIRKEYDKMKYQYAYDVLEIPIMYIPYWIKSKKGIAERLESGLREINLL